MRTIPGVFSGFIARTLASICLLLLAGFVRSHAEDTPQTPKLHCLSETSYLPDGTIFFFDNSYQEYLSLSHDEMATGIKTNAPVIVYNATQEGQVQAALSSWVDLRGFTHSIDVLKRQVLFNSWLSKIPGGTPRKPSPVLLTGILDYPTLTASYHQLRYHLNYVEAHLKDLCRAAIDPCKNPPWPGGEIELIVNNLGPAQQSLEAYINELADVDTTPPTPYEGICDGTDSINLHFDAPHSDPWEGLYDGSQSEIKYTGDSSPEMNVDESVDLQALDSEELSRLASLEQDAQRRVQYLSELSGDPY